MPAAQQTFTIEQGATWRQPLTYEDSNGDPVDLTGYTARMQVRKKTSTPDPPLLDLTTENGGITLGGTDGTILLEATDEQTAALDFKTGRYDLELYPGDGTTKRLLMGSVILSREVTR